MASSPGDEVLGRLRPERSGASGDQKRRMASDLERRLALGQTHGLEAGREPSSLAYGRLGGVFVVVVKELVDQLACRRRTVGVGIEVDRSNPESGALSSDHAGESPRRCLFVVNGMLPDEVGPRRDD